MARLWSRAGRRLKFPDTWHLSTLSACVAWRGVIDVERQKHALPAYTSHLWSLH